MIVMKFGGSSLQSAESIEQAISIIRTRLSHRPLVVVSALGKVTDRLLLLGREAAAGQRRQWLQTFTSLKEYHASVAGALPLDGHRHHLSDFLQRHFDELESLATALAGSGCLTPEAQDVIASFGERLSSGIVAMALQACGISSAHLDSRALICTDNRHTHATPLVSQTYRNIHRAVQGLPSNVVPVVGGFMGTSADGRTTTLGRNSSNLTAVLFAAAIRAQRVEMWTDVDGVYHRDPRHVLDQTPVPEMSFTEALDIARNGARVLHYGAVLLASQENIPVYIKNTARPGIPGTRISADPVPAGTSPAGSCLGAVGLD